MLFDGSPPQTWRKTSIDLEAGVEFSAGRTGGDVSFQGIDSQKISLFVTIPKHDIRGVTTKSPGVGESLKAPLHSLDRIEIFSTHVSSALR